ncbi:MAG TPA: alanine--glyoxylate aminotransferase family protein [Chthonomonadaceae bacterium]|nr:alanine--glyoxylate aminotransferase family protein [Chthonomonadaceae bacterium]
MDKIPFPRLLMGPGPSAVSERVLEALAQPPIGYVDPEIFLLLDRIRARLRQVFGTENAFTFPQTGTGMSGMESCLANLIEPGDNIGVGIHGFFGGRMSEIARRLGAQVTEVHAEWGHILEPEQIEAALRPLSAVKLIACVQAETSTGIAQPLEPIAQIARQREALFVVDAVTSLGGMPVEVDRIGIDAAYSATQKCLGAPPGLAPVAVSDRAWEVVTDRKAATPVWYDDWRLLRTYYDAPHAYHHTVPVNLYYALDAALAEIEEETLPQRYARHREISAQLREALQGMGIPLFGVESHRLPMISVFQTPPGVEDEAAVRKRLLYEHGIEIGGGLGQLKGKIWRIGMMGSSATQENVTRLVTALRAVLA